MNEPVYLGCIKCNREEAFSEDKVKGFSKNNPFICIDCVNISDDTKSNDDYDILKQQDNDRKEKIKQRESIAFAEDDHDYNLQLETRLSERQYNVRTNARKSYTRRYYERNKEILKRHARPIEPKIAADIIRSANAIFAVDEESGIYSNEQIISNQYQQNDHCFNCDLNLKSSENIQYIKITNGDKYLLVCKRCNDYYSK